LWGLLRLLDKTVEQYCLALLDRKQHAGNPAAIEISPNLKEPVAYRTAGGHADRPAEFDCPNIISNSLAILGTHGHAANRGRAALRQTSGKTRLAAFSPSRCTKSGSEQQAFAGRDVAMHARRGCRAARFWNYDAMYNLSGVLEIIRRELNVRQR
jgi:hypothetical protein